MCCLGQTWNRTGEISRQSEDKTGILLFYWIDVTDTSAIYDLVLSSIGSTIPSIV